VHWLVLTRAITRKPARIRALISQREFEGCRLVTAERLTCPPPPCIFCRTHTVGLRLRHAANSVQNASTAVDRSAVGCGASAGAAKKHYHRDDGASSSGSEAEEVDDADDDDVECEEDEEDDDDDEDEDDYDDAEEALALREAGLLLVNQVRVLIGGTVHCVVLSSAYFCALQRMWFASIFSITDAWTASTSEAEYLRFLGFLRDSLHPTGASETTTAFVAPHLSSVTAHVFTNVSECRRVETRLV
jgi:hypothetical protein